MKIMKEKSFSSKKLLLTILITTSCVCFLTFAIRFIISLNLNTGLTASNLLITNSIENNIKYSSIEETLKNMSDTDYIGDNLNEFYTLNHKIRKIYGEEYTTEGYVFYNYFVFGYNTLLSSFNKAFIYSTFIGVFLGFIIYFTFIEKNKTKDIILKSIITGGMLTLIMVFIHDIYCIIINCKIRNYYGVDLTQIVFENIRINYLIVLLSLFIATAIVLLSKYIYTRLTTNKVKD